MPLLSHSYSLSRGKSYAKSRCVLVGFLLQRMRVGSESWRRAVARQRSLTREESEVAKGLAPPGAGARQPGLTKQPTLPHPRHGTLASVLCRLAPHQLLRRCGRMLGLLAAAQALI
jgi:hypothetical protein